jgi:hypothetical protein
MVPGLTTAPVGRDPRAWASALRSASTVQQVNSHDTQVWTAAATSAAAVVALGLGIYTEVRLRRDRKDEKRERAAEQAAKVSAWAEIDQSGEREKWAGFYPAVAVILNYSDGPIYSVRAEPGWQDSSPVMTAIVPPGECVRFNLSGGLQDTGLPMRVTFRDPGGRWWCRGFDGAMAETTDPSTANDALGERPAKSRRRKATPG